MEKHCFWRKCALCIMALSASLAFFSSCEKDEPQALPASVRISINSTTASSIGFSLVPQNAVSMAYAVKQAFEEGDPEFNVVESGDSTFIKVENLVENTTYVIYANATNQAGETSGNVSQEAVTTSNAYISIELLQAGAKSVTFLLRPVNAARMGYAVVLPSESETCELVMEETGMEKEITKDGLEPNTSYTIVAQAFNSDGDASERAFRSVRTEKDPVVSINEVKPSYSDATINFTCSDVVSLHYAVTEAGSDPAEADFKTISEIGDKTSLTVYGLEPETEYTVHMYGTGQSGYVGEMDSCDFATVSESDANYTVKISDVTSLDATVTVSFKTDTIRDVAWIVGSRESIGDPEAFDWNTAINVNWTAKTINAGSIDYPMSLANTWPNAGIEPGAVVLAGFVPRGITNRDILAEQAIWKEITFEELIFGSSDVSVTINEKRISHRSMTFSLSTDNASGYYYGIEKSSVLQGEESIEYFITSYLMAGYSGGLLSDFDKDISKESLEIGTDYTLVVLPVGPDGGLGNYIVHEFCTKPVNTDGVAVVDASVTDIGYTYISISAELDENTECLYYYLYNPSDASFDEETCMKSMLTGFDVFYENGVKNFVSSPNDVACNHDYEVWFCAEDKDGNLSEVKKEKVHTKVPVFDGIGNIDVVVSDSKAKISPDENIKAYWAGMVLPSFDDDDEYVINNVLRTRIDFTDNVSVEYDNARYEGDAMIDVSGGWTLCIVAEDNQGRLLPIIRKEIE